MTTETDVRTVPGPPTRLFEPRVCRTCHTWMRRGTHVVYLGGETVHASPATCKAAVRRRTTREAQWAESPLSENEGAQP